MSIKAGGSCPHFPLLSVDSFVGNVIFEIHVAIESQGVHLPAITIVEGCYQQPGLLDNRLRNDLLNNLPQHTW